MTLKKHHKWVIGGFSSVVIIFMVVTGILLNGIIVKQTINHNELSNKIENLQTDTQSKLNELTNSIIEIESGLEETKTTLEKNQQELTKLKASASSDFSGVIEDSIKAVVTVRTDVSQGTGFLITSDGYIVTNAHVLSGGSEVYVLDYEQNKKTTQFIGYDATLDIALLKISENQDYLELGNSDDVTLGEKVIAIGNPLGLQFSVSEGIVSGVNRLGPNDLEAYIQTDAALNPGNSGGPLINTKGEAIGINNFKVSDGESLGFALESNYIEDAVNEIAQETLGENLL